MSLAGGHREAGAVGVFACYLDDSDDRLSSVITLAGYVAPISAWKSFEDEVAPIFDRYEVPILHAKDLHGTKGCFRGWSKLRKKSFVAEIYSVAASRVSFGISVSVRKSAIPHWHKDYPKNSGMSAYGICFASIMHTAIYNNSLGGQIQNQGISFIVESGHKNNAEIEKRFDKALKHELYSGIARSIKFSSKQSCRAIQMADLSAFYSRRFSARADRFDHKSAMSDEEPYNVAQRFVRHYLRVLTDLGRKVSAKDATIPDFGPGISN